MTIQPDLPEAVGAQEIVAALSVGIALVDEAGRYRYVNEPYAALHGLRPKALLGRSFTELLASEEREAALQRHRAMLVAGDPSPVAFEENRGEGVRRPLVVNTVALDLPTGNYRLEEVSVPSRPDVAPAGDEDGDARFRYVFENTREGIYLAMPDGRLADVNWPLVRMHQCDSKEALIGAVHNLSTDWYVDAADQKRFAEMLHRDGEVRNFEAEVHRAGGGRLWTSENASTIRDERGNVAYFLGTVRDVTEEHRLREFAANRTEILKRIARGDELVDILYELIGAIEQYRPRLTAAICGLRAGRLHVQAAPGLANQCIEAIHKRSPSNIGGALAAVMNAERPVVDAEAAEDRDPGSGLVHAMNEAGYTHLMALPVRDLSGEVLGVLAVFVASQSDTEGDIAGILEEMAQITSIAFEQQGLTDQLLHQAQYDPLTQLPNRALLNDRLGQIILEAGRNKNTVGVMMIDLDEFKLVNDTLGHQAGDTLLQFVAERLRGCLRASDTVARFGGDEFVVIAHLPERGRATDVAERILEALQPPCTINDHSLHARPSIGISLFPQDGDSGESLMQAADTAMYAAKLAGKNRYHFFAESMNDEVTHRLQIEGELRRAIEQGELELHYQPVIALADESVVGAEALLRWQHPERGLMMPGSFLPVAEQSSLVGEVDHYVLGAAMRQIAEWHSSGHKLLMSLIITSLNLSARGLHEEGFAARVGRILRSAGIDPACIELEITESMIMRDFDGAVAQLRALKEGAPGLRVAIDDFGTGHASFAYLRHLPVDTLKIDMTFIADLERPEAAKTARAIIKTMVELGRNLELTVVAEGVETRAQADFLRSVGCHRAQGFLFSYPLDAAAFEAHVSY